MIIKNNVDKLRVKCEDVSEKEVADLIYLLERELKESEKNGAPGIGLAAPQININKNIAIVRIDNNNRVNLVNCKIDKMYDPVIFNDEGCLSFPGRLENTTRYKEVHISNNLVYPNKFIATGLMAVVCQHEIDHLNGNLFFDHAIKTNQLISGKKIGPNDPCICNKIDLLTGKIKKYKKCCGK